MKKFFALAAAAATLSLAAFAAPASAAPYNGGYNINARQAQLEQRIDIGARQGRLTRAEAGDLRGQLRNISFVERNYRRGGLSFSERQDLDRRLDRVSVNLEHQLNDRDHRGGHRR